MTFQKQHYLRKHNVISGNKSTNQKKNNSISRTTLLQKHTTINKSTKSFRKMTSQKTHQCFRKHISENIAEKMTWHQKHNHKTESKIPNCTSEVQRMKLQSIRTMKDCDWQAWCCRVDDTIPARHQQLLQRKKKKWQGLHTQEEEEEKAEMNKLN